MAGPEFSSWGTQQAADGDTEQQDSPEKLFHANKKLKKKLLLSACVIKY